MEFAGFKRTARDAITGKSHLELLHDIRTGRNDRLMDGNTGALTGCGLVVGFVADFLRGAGFRAGRGGRL